MIQQGLVGDSSATQTQLAISWTAGASKVDSGRELSKDEGDVPESDRKSCNTDCCELCDTLDYSMMW